ncbi:unnamed protein product [Amoebophrya sp. A120]|nr:unnamed protein product [Amoebophrya sp. A120]|eukprot:GSA120T00004948001.1
MSMQPGGEPCPIHSEDYISWMESSYLRFMEQQQRKRSVNTESYKKATKANSASTAALLKECKSAADEGRGLWNIYDWHRNCRIAAGAGWFCSNPPASQDALVWLANPDHKKSKDGAASSQTPGRTAEFWQGGPRVRAAFSKANDECIVTTSESLSKSVLQEQLRVWMGVVRRQSGRVSPAHLPVELFLKIKEFVPDPVNAVMLNSQLFSEIAMRKRAEDVENLLHSAVTNIFDSVVHVEAGTTTAPGQVFWIRDPDRVRFPGNTRFEIGLGDRIYSIEGKTMWPSEYEDAVMESEAWAEQRQKEIDGGSAFVRLPGPEAKYANVMPLVRRFFESRGLKFTQDGEDLSRFEVSWA